MSRNVTLHRGESERNWQILAGYCTIGLLGVAFGGYQMLTSTGGRAFDGEGMFVLGLLVLTFGSVAAYIALFRDAAYLRANRGFWNPKWWYYIGFGAGVPVAVYVILDSGLQMAYGGPIAILLVPLTTTIMALAYLYRRHAYVGVP